jgi:hypothetical protein
MFLGRSAVRFLEREGLSALKAHLVMRRMQPLRAQIEPAQG